MTNEKTLSKEEQKNMEDARLEAQTIETYTNAKDLSTYKNKLIKEQNALAALTAPTAEQQMRLNELNEIVGTVAGRNDLTNAKESVKKNKTATPGEQKIIDAEIPVSEDWKLMEAYVNEKSTADAEKIFAAFTSKQRESMTKAYVKGIQTVVKSYIRKAEIEKNETVEEKMKAEFEGKVAAFVPEGYTARLVRIVTKPSKTKMETDGDGHVDTTGEKKKYYRVYNPALTENQTIGIFNNAKAAMVKLHPELEKGEKFNENLNAATVIYRFASKHKLMVDSEYELPSEQMELPLETESAKAPEAETAKTAETIEA